MACLASTTARGAEYAFSSLSIDDGLSQSSAISVLRDSRGYVWVGTHSGLNRYDHGDMRVYFSDPDDASTISGNEVLEIFEDAEGRVWTISNKGTAIYDRDSDSFSRLTYGERLLAARSYALLPGGVLLGGEGRLYFYDYESRRTNIMPTTGGSTRTYTSIEPWAPDRLLLSTRWDGLWLYNLETGRIDRLGIYSGRDVMTCRVDGDGKLWVSSYGEGLYCYERSGRLAGRFGEAEIGSEIVLDLLAADGLMWVATDGGGLHTIDVNTMSVGRVGADRIGLSSVACLHRDPYGYVYAGTVREGLMCIALSAMRTFSPLAGEKGKAVTSLLADGEDIWVGVDGGGIAMFSGESGRFERFPSTAGMKVTSMEHFDQSHILVSVFDNGMCLLDKRTGAVTPAPMLFDQIVASNAKKALALELRRLPGKRMAVMSDRIYIVDLAGNSYVEAPSTRVSSRLTEFFTDNKSMLCFSDGEVIRYDYNSGLTKTVAAFHGRDIACAVYDGARFVFVGTNGGIEKIDVESGEIRHFWSTPPSHKRITAMAIDGSRLWVGAGGGVYAIGVEDGQDCRFDRYDGVEPNEFIYKATLSTPSTMYMGGVNGLLKINRSEVGAYIAERTSLPVEVTDVSIDGVAMVGFDPGREVNVPYDHSSVTMRVAGGDTHPLRQMPFRFYVNSPGESAPIEISDNTFAITKLAAGGHYDIYAQSVAPDGKWTEPVRVAMLNVASPWWKTPWAIMLYILLSMGVVAAGMAYNLRRRRLVSEKRLAEIRRESLEKEVDFLTEMNHELRAPLTLIYSRLRGMMDAMAGGDAKDKDVYEELQNIYQSTRRMRDIMNTTVDQWVAPTAAETGVEERKIPGLDILPARVDDDFSGLSELTVVIAEEDNELSDYVAMHLRRVFGKVITADGSTVLAELKNSNPDLIIIDAKLGGKSGATYCSHIKAMSEYSHIPIVMLTTRVEDTNLRNGLDLGADVYISKPFDIGRLTSQCRAVLRAFNRVKMRYLSQSDDAIPHESYNNESESFLLKIKEIIEKNISHPEFGVDTIVDTMLISRSSLYAKFKELTGQSLGVYIDEYRLSRAKEMLFGSSMTMSEISDALGFSTQRYFSTFFKKKTGMSPSQFRAEYHENSNT